MRIGIYLNYRQDTKLTSEGLGRYTGSLINGLIKTGNEVVIACPRWFVSDAKELIDDLQIDGEKIEYITPHNGLPVVVKLYNFLSKDRVEKPKHNYLNKIIEALMVSIAMQNSILMFIFEALILFVLVFLRLILEISKRVYSKFILKGFKFIKKKSFVNGLVTLFYTVIGNQILIDSGKELVKKINKEARVDIWYVPSLFWPEVNRIKNGKVIINAPDLVTEQFPNGFADLMDAYHTDKCRKTLDEGKIFITYCKYVGDTLIDQKYGFGVKKWYAIPHPNHDMLKSIYISEEYGQRLCTDKDLTLEFARELLCTVNLHSNVITGRNLANFGYIFYASQGRPNKNIISFLEAYRYLLRNKFIHERLIFTARYDSKSHMAKYIKKHNLENDIVFCSGVSNQQLAALYKCAKLVVNPTLYEGGFPFTFGEGMSVGTPSVMSDIPQTREIFDKYDCKHILFDPYDVMDIADKIEWGLNNTEDLYVQELQIYNEMKDRTDEVVSNEYIKVFEECM